MNRRAELPQLTVKNVPKALGGGCDQAAPQGEYCPYIRERCGYNLFDDVHACHAEE